MEGKKPSNKIGKSGDIQQDPGYARSLIEASVDPLVTISAEGKITDVNKATEDATGLTRGELIGTDFSIYFTEPEKAREGYQKVLEEGVVRDYPLTIKSKVGKLIDVLYNASVYKDKEGKVLGVFAAARDITEQKQASQYARSLIEASLDPLVTISPEGKITDVNDATIKVTGVEREELIGTKFSEYFTEPDKADQGYQEVLKSGEVRDYALTIRHAKGKLVDVLYNASVYKDEKGKVIGVFAAARDITKTKHATEYARSLIEASLDPLVTISPEGKITDVNQATIRITGVTKQELIGSDFSDYFTEPEKARNGYQQVFKRGEVRDYLLTIRHRSGKLTNVLYNASVYKDPQGKVLGVFAAAREIGKSELKAARARELMKASKEAVFKVTIGFRISQNSVKISEKNCETAGLDMVDDIVVKPTRKEIANRKITVMSMSDSKLPEDTILMSKADARILGLEEEDTVFIYKSEEGIGEPEEEEHEIPEISNQTIPETEEEQIFEKEPEGVANGNTSIPKNSAQETPAKEPVQSQELETTEEKPGTEEGLSQEEPEIKEKVPASEEKSKAEAASKETTKPKKKLKESNKKHKKLKSNPIEKEKPIAKNKKMKDFESQIDALRST